MHAPCIPHQKIRLPTRGPRKYATIPIFIRQLIRVMSAECDIFLNCYLADCGTLIGKIPAVDEALQILQTFGPVRPIFTLFKPRCMAVLNVAARIVLAKAAESYGKFRGFLMQRNDAAAFMSNAFRLMSDPQVAFDKAYILLSYCVGTTF